MICVAGVSFVALWIRLRSAAIGPAVAVHVGYNAVIAAWGSLLELAVTGCRPVKRLRVLGGTRHREHRLHQQPLNLANVANDLYLSEAASTERTWRLAENFVRDS